MSGMNEEILKKIEMNEEILKKLDQVPLWNDYYIIQVVRIRQKIRKKIEKLQKQKMMNCIDKGIEYNSKDDKEFQIKNKEVE